MRTILQLLKFGLVGVTNTIVSLLVYYIMIYFGVNYIVATVCGYIGSSIVGYILNRMWVFKARDKKVKSSVLKYYIVYGTSLIINIGCMYFWIDVTNLSKYIAPVLTLCITIPYNYILSKKWVFKAEKKGWSE